MEGKIKWCFEQKKGISLIKSNKELSKEYLKQAKDDIISAQKRDDNWQIIILYYSCYNALYSVLIRYGIKSEIHSCSLELMDLFDNLKDFKHFLKDLKEKREKIQYYMIEVGHIDISKVKKFIDICEMELIDISLEKITKIRNSLEEIKCQK